MLTGLQYTWLDKIIGIDSPVSKIIMGILLLIAVGMALLGSYNYLFGYAILGIIISILGIYLIVYKPKWWIYSIAMSSIFFFRASSEGLSVIDVLTGAYFMGTLVTWLLWQILVKRRNLIRNNGDRLLLFFFLIIPVNLILAIVNNVPILDWIREFSLLFILLYYFPIREYFTKKSDIIILLSIYFLVVLAHDFIQFYQYYKIVFTNLIHVYQLGTSVRVNQQLFTSASLFGILIAMIQKQKSLHLTMLMFSALTIAALVVSFSRTYWVLLLFSIFLVLFYLSPADRKKLLIYIVTITTISLTAAFFLFGDKLEFILLIIQKRFLSTAMGTEDVSVLLRLNEWNAVIKEILEKPLGGSGMAKVFYYFNPYFIVTEETNYIHNAYLFFSYRLGIPMAILFFIPSFRYLIKGEYLSRKIRDPFFKVLVIGSFLSILIMLISNYFTTTYLGRDAIFVMAISFAFIGIGEKHFEENQKY